MNKQIDKKILYVGNDTEYLRRLEDFYYVRIISSRCLVEQVTELEVTNLFAVVMEKLPQLVIIDFSQEESFSTEVLEQLGQELYLLKSNPLFKGIACVGLFLDQEKVLAALGLAAVGMSYFFIKGSENVFSLLDSFYIAFEQNIPIPHFAKAQNLELPYQFKFLAAITNCQKEAIVIESDILLEIDDDLHLDNSLVDGQMPSNLKVEERESFTDNFFFYRYQLSIPFCGPWDDPDETNIMADTYETWLNFSREEFLLEKYGRALFFIHEAEVLTEVAALAKKYKSILFKVISQLELGILYSRPDLIFIQLVVHDEDEHLYQHVAQIVHTIQQIPDYTPLIVLFSSPSTRDALEKIYNYGNFITSHAAFSIPLVENMLQKAQKHFEQREVVQLEFPLLHPNALGYVVRSVQITSLTEHYITFYAEKDIPMYSIFRLDVPVSMLVTIIPPIDFLPGKEQSQHYQGIINGISVEQRAILRRFVNFLLHKQPSEFSWQEEESDNDEDLMVDLTPAVEVQGVEQSDDRQLPSRDLAGEKIKKIIKKRKYEGKSKL